MNYKILAALKSDTNDGWIWITHPLDIPSRSIVQVKNQANRKSIFCEALMIEDNYRRDYSSGSTIKMPKTESIVTMNSWYRNKLGISKTNLNYDLKIKPANHLYGKLRSIIQHPQIVVRVASWLGIISLFLGILGVLLSLKNA